MWKLPVLRPGAGSPQPPLSWALPSHCVVSGTSDGQAAAHPHLSFPLGISSLSAPIALSVTPCTSALPSGGSASGLSSDTPIPLPSPPSWPLPSESTPLLFCMRSPLFAGSSALTTNRIAAMSIAGGRASMAGTAPRNNVSSSALDIFQGARTATLCCRRLVPCDGEIGKEAFIDKETSSTRRSPWKSGNIAQIRFPCGVLIPPFFLKPVRAFLDNWKTGPRHLHSTPSFPRFPQLPANPLCKLRRLCGERAQNRV